ncbi:MAG: Eco57I restriction-modification methylase domain-containing protein [Oscillospiraceae bacterium]
MESHAYEWIHVDNPEEIFNMKFDVIIANPPYQLKVNEAGKGLGAIPIYNKFVTQMQKTKTRYMSMIIPARWFSGGVGLDDFRRIMLENNHMKYIVDYIDSKDCFPGVDVNGGICYFLIDNLYSGKCNYTSICKNIQTTSYRDLNEFDIFIRRNEAVSIIHKIKSLNEKTLSSPGGCSPQTPYGFLSTYEGKSKRTSDNDCELLSSRGWSYVDKNDIQKSTDTINLFKPMISKLSCEHAGNPDKNGMFRVLSRMEILKPKQICNQSYLTVCPRNTYEEAKNVYNYLRTKFVRFLILQTLAGMNLSIANFKFVPWQDFSKSWTDEELYKKYDLTDEEISFIESLIKPMDLGGDNNAR